MENGSFGRKRDWGGKKEYRTDRLKIMSIILDARLSRFRFRANFLKTVRAYGIR